jgi:hypothetical protein
MVPDTKQSERVTIEITDVGANAAFAEVVERVSYYDQWKANVTACTLLPNLRSTNPRLVMVTRYLLRHRGWRSAAGRRRSPRRR